MALVLKSSFHLLILLMITPTIICANINDQGPDLQFTNSLPFNETNMNSHSPAVVFFQRVFLALPNAQLSHSSTFPSIFVKNDLPADSMETRLFSALEKGTILSL
jgi:hypothetical protein